MIIMNLFFRELDSKYMKKMTELLNLDPHKWKQKYMNWNHMCLDSSKSLGDDFVLVSQ